MSGTAAPNDVTARLETAIAAARLAGHETLRWFGDAGLVVDVKADASPVTQADRAAEAILRRELLGAFPADAFLGEETGATAGTSGYEWIIDPIDGTKSFISGVPLYSTLVGMTYLGQPCIGVIAIPALGEMCVAATGAGAWYGNGLASNPADRDRLHPCRVSSVDSLSEGLFLTSQVDNFDRRNAQLAYRELERTAYVSRSWGDGYGYLLVATGRAELMVDPIVNPWDVAAVAPVILEAGGAFTSWSGQVDIRAGHCLASNGRLHAAALETLRPFASVG